MRHSVIPISICWTNASFAKATHIFFSKNTCELDTVLTRTVSILTTNELIKLTMLWTTGPSSLGHCHWRFNSRPVHTRSQKAYTDQPLTTICKTVSETEWILNSIHHGLFKEIVFFYKCQISKRKKGKNTITCNNILFGRWVFFSNKIKDYVHA